MVYKLSGKTSLWFTIFNLQKKSLTEDLEHDEGIGTQSFRSSGQTEHQSYRSSDPVDDDQEEEEEDGSSQFEEQDLDQEQEDEDFDVSSYKTYNTVNYHSVYVSIFKFIS